jgi:hypothetical protein
VTSLRDGCDKFFTFFRFPKAQWNMLPTRTRSNGATRSSPPRVKTQRFAVSDENTAVVLLFGLIGSGQVKLRRIHGWKKIRPLR